METIGQRVIRVRNEKGWNQARLVRESKLPQSTIASIENDSRTKESSAIIEVAHTLGVDAYWLKTGKGSRGGVELSADEQLILEAFRQFPDDRRDDWLFTARRTAKTNKGRAIQLADYRR